MIRTFIPDKEINLLGESDLLKTKVYADNLVKIINNTPSNEVFTIGLFGGWGTGKSSIVNTCKDVIEEQSKKKVKFIVYDAWKYSNDSFRRMFLLKLQQELKMEQTPEMERFYQSETAEQKPTTVWSSKGLAIVISVFTVLMALLWLTPLKLDWKVGVTTMGTLLSLVFALFNGCFYDLKLTLNKPALFAPEQFEVCFKQMMSLCLEHYSFIGKLIKKVDLFVTTGKNTIIGLDKLVIVIDNIDRCPSDMAYQLLTDIKTFLSNEEYNLVFVIPVDDEALKKHLFRKLDERNGYNIDKEKEEFLRKFFNVALRIKPHQEYELLHFVHKINEVNQLKYNNETLALTAKEFSDNPRRIIQLLNNLNTELSLYDDDFAQKNESAIAATLILREEYPEFYKLALKDLNHLSKFKVEEKSEHKDILLKVETFMRIAQSAYRNVNINDLQRIFTNTSSLYDAIPADIRKAANTYDSEALATYINEHSEEKDDVIKMCIRNMDTEAKYYADGQQASWLSFFAEMHGLVGLPKQDLLSIDRTLNKRYTVIVPMVDNTEDVSKLAVELNNYGSPALKKSILEYLVADKSKGNTNYPPFIKSSLGTFNSTEDCKALHAISMDFFDKQPIFEDVSYSDAQKKSLFDDEFVESQIQSMDYREDGFKEGNIIWCIKNSLALGSRPYEVLCNKIIELFGNTRGKALDDYLNMIKYSMQFLTSMEDGKAYGEMEPLYSLAVSNRGIPNPSWPDRPQYDNQISIINECDSESAWAIAEFCLEIVRVSNGSTEVAPTIKELIPECGEKIYSSIKALMLKGISISQFAGIIMSSDNYENEDILVLTEHLFIIRPDAPNLLSDKVITNKLSSLIDHVNIKSVEDVVCRLGENENYKDLVANDIAARDNQFINTLPTSVSKLAVAAFTKESSSTFANNYPYLSHVAKEGSASQRHLIVGMMKKQLIDGHKLELVLDVLSNLHNLNNTDANSLCEELRSAKEQVVDNEELATRIDEMISQFTEAKKKIKN